MINENKIIAICTSRVNDSTTYDFINALNELVIKQNWRIFVYHVCSDYYWTNEDVSADAAIYDLIDYKIIDAVIIMDEKVKSKKITGQIIDNARENKVPVFIVDGVYEGCYSFCFDYKSGFEKVVRHIVEEHKIRNLHFMAGIKDNSFSEDRLNVFKKVIEENGIEFKEEMVSYGAFWADPTRLAMEEVINSGHVPEAVICANDIMAINVCAVLEEYGYKIPDDVLVTGFDGIDEIYAMHPQITSVKCDYAVVANKVYTALLDCFLGWKIPFFNEIIPEFICGQSCGCKNENIKQDINFYNKLNTCFYRYQDDTKQLLNIAQRLQNVYAYEDISKALDDDILTNVSILINKKCIDETKNITDLRSEKGFDDDFIVLRNPENKLLENKHLKRNEIYDEIDGLFYKQVPIIFNAIYSFDTLFGYMCFYFDSPSITNYGKITEMITSVSIGISGYINVRNQKYLKDMLEDIYKNDSLTGLLTRKGFDQEFAVLKESISESNGKLTVILSDLDRLKVINDSLGHVAGDKAIVTVAKALKNSCPKDAICARIGGDEFLAVFSSNCDVSEIEKRINLEIDLFNAKSNIGYDISTSIGYFQTDSLEEMNFDTLVSKADKFLYIKKEQHHKNQ